MSENAMMRELLDLARDNSVAGRTSLVGTVSDLYFTEAAEFTEREIALMTDILRRLIHDVEMSVRLALAERLADRPDAPRDLVVTLANDRIEVAKPILVRSPVLRDDELIEIIRHRSAEHQLAVAMRGSLMPAVSATLVEGGDERVIVTLLDNENAEISKATVDYLVEMSLRIDKFQRPLLGRRELSPDLAKKMYWSVSAALRQHILQNFAIEPEELDEAMAETITQVIEESRDGAEDGNKARSSLVDHLCETNALTPRFLIQVLREGEIPLFEDMFVKLTGLAKAMARRIIYSPGGEALAVICRAIGIEKADFASIFLLSRQGRPGDKTVDPGELAKVLAHFDGLDRETTQRALDEWRLEPEYLKAILDLKAKGPSGSQGQARRLG